jgi:hypothetical protein
MTGRPDDAAQRRAKSLTDLLWHVGVFVIVNGFFWILDLLVGVSGIQWAYWITLFWGLGLAFHALSYAIAGRQVEVRKAQQYRDADAAPPPRRTAAVVSTRIAEYRRVAIWVGVLYIVATVAPVSTLAAWGALEEEPGILTNAADDAGRVAFVALMNLVMAVAVSGVALMLYPVLTDVADTKVKQGLGAWYVGTRLTESAMFVVAVTLTLSFLPLSREFAEIDGSSGVLYQSVADVLETTVDLSWALGQTVFAVGAAMLYYLLFHSRLVPRWLSLWGLLASPLFVVASLSLLWTWDPDSSVSTVLYAPMALQEMVLAVWLIAKGFNQTALSSAADGRRAVGDVR